MVELPRLRPDSPSADRFPEMQQGSGQMNMGPNPPFDHHHSQSPHGSPFHPHNGPQNHNLEPHDPLNGPGALSSHYEGYTFTKLRIPGQQDSWKMADKKRMNFEQDELKSMAKSKTKKTTAIALYKQPDMKGNKRILVDKLIRDRTLADSRYKYSLASLSLDYAANGRSTTAMDVILRRELSLDDEHDRLRDLDGEVIDLTEHHDRNSFSASSHGSSGGSSQPWGREEPHEFFDDRPSGDLRETGPWVHVSRSEAPPPPPLHPHPHPQPHPEFENGSMHPHPQPHSAFENGPMHPHPHPHPQPHSAFENGPMHPHLHPHPAFETGLHHPNPDLGHRPQQPDPDFEHVPQHAKPDSAHKPQHPGMNNEREPQRAQPGLDQGFRQTSPGFEHRSQQPNPGSERRPYCFIPGHERLGQQMKTGEPFEEPTGEYMQAPNHHHDHRQGNKKHSTKARDQKYRDSPLYSESDSTSASDDSSFSRAKPYRTRDSDLSDRDNQRRYPHEKKHSKGHKPRRRDSFSTREHYDDLDKTNRRGGGRSDGIGRRDSRRSSRSSRDNEHDSNSTFRQWRRKSPVHSASSSQSSGSRYLGADFDYVPSSSSRARDRHLPSHRDSGFSDHRPIIHQRTVSSEDDTRPARRPQLYKGNQSSFSRVPDSDENWREDLTRQVTENVTQKVQQELLKKENEELRRHNMKLENEKLHGVGMPPRYHESPYMQPIRGKYSQNLQGGGRLHGLI